MTKRNPPTQLFLLISWLLLQEFIPFLMIPIVFFLHLLKFLQKTFAVWPYNRILIPALLDDLGHHGRASGREGRAQVGLGGLEQYLLVGRVSSWSIKKASYLKIISNQWEFIEGFLVSSFHATNHHLPQYDAKAVDVRFGTVRFSKVNFRCGVSVRPAHLTESGLFLFQKKTRETWRILSSIIAGKFLPKSAILHIQCSSICGRYQSSKWVVTYQEIETLKVPVNYLWSPWMQAIYPSDCIDCNGYHVAPFEVHVIILQHIVQCTPGTVFHDDAHFWFKYSSIEIYNIWRSHWTVRSVKRLTPV